MFFSVGKLLGQQIFSGKISQSFPSGEWRTSPEFMRRGTLGIVKPVDFVETLKALNLADTFNPYSDQCPINDCDDAPCHRSNTLLSILESATVSEIDSLWIGRDLGYRGGRRTGLALTDDVHVTAHTERWGISTERVTKGEVVAERTAAVVWSVLNQIDINIFLWNVFPLHPHQPNQPFTNRSHNARERRIGEELLQQLILLLKPRRVVPIGNDAAASVCRLLENRDVFQIRHPSFGGQNQFLKQVRELYDLDLLDFSAATTEFSFADYEVIPMFEK